MLGVLSILLALTKGKYKHVSLTETVDSMTKREKDILVLSRLIHLPSIGHLHQDP